MSDLSQPLADRAHEDLRVNVRAAIADVADGLGLTDVALELIDAIFVQLDDLTARLDALENPTP